MTRPDDTPRPSPEGLLAVLILGALAALVAGVLFGARLAPPGGDPD